MGNLGNLFLRTLLGTHYSEPCAWEPDLEPLLGDLFLGIFALEPVPGNPDLGTQPLFANIINPCLGPVPGNPCLGTLVMGFRAAPTCFVPSILWLETPSLRCWGKGKHVLSWKIRSHHASPVAVGEWPGQPAETG